MFPWGSSLEATLSNRFAYVISWGRVKVGINICENTTDINLYFYREPLPLLVNNTEVKITEFLNV